MEITVTKKVLPIAVFDLAALLLVYILPAAAHLTAIPFYLAEPFRLIVLTSVVLLNDKNNALVLGMTLPLISFAISGHPLLLKVLLISIELVMNVLLYSWLVAKTDKSSIVLLISIIASKVIYYILKFTVVSFGLLTMSLVSTSLLIQLIVAIATALLFGHLRKQLKHNG